jgi:hypothetical protein
VYPHPPRTQLLTLLRLNFWNPLAKCVDKEAAKKALLEELEEAQCSRLSSSSSRHQGVSILVGACPCRQRASSNPGRAPYQCCHACHWWPLAMHLLCSCDECVISAVVYV